MAHALAGHKYAVMRFPAGALPVSIGKMEVLDGATHLSHPVSIIARLSDKSPLGLDSLVHMNHMVACMFYPETSLVFGGCTPT